VTRLFARLAAFAAALALLAAPAAAQKTVTLSADDQARLGVASTPLRAESAPRTAPAYIRVLDLAALAKLDSDLAAATAASAASASDAVRTARLAGQDRSASQQALEAARAQAAADAAHVDQLTSELLITWGPALAQMKPEERASLVSAAASGEAAILRADAPERPEGLVGRVLINPGASSSSDAPVIAEPLGPTGAVDPRMQTLGLLCVVRGEAAALLRPGRVLAGAIELSDRVSGAMLPRSSIVRIDGGDWAYVRTGPETFERRPIAEPLPLPEGWLVASGFAEGDSVVDRGAGSLLAVESAPAEDAD
jgi:hypothetical protein